MTESGPFSSAVRSQDEIVVGVDGSAPSRDALAWAAEEAEVRGCGVRAISSYLPVRAANAGSLTQWGAALSRQLVGSIQQRLAASIHAVARQHPGVPITAQVIEGPAAKVLVAESEGAADLVVGSRAHVGLLGVLLGSVSHECVDHARCPVTVVGPGAQVEHHQVAVPRPQGDGDWGPM